MIAITRLAAAAALTLAACVAASPPGNGSPTTVAARDGAGGTTASCDSVCAHLVACNALPDDGTCVPGCQQGGYDGATLTRFQNGSCPEVTQWLADMAKQARADTGGGGGGGYLCTAEGVYEVCDGDFCRDQSADGTGVGPTQEAAGADARQSCGFHMSSLIISAQINNRASQKSSCQVTSCHR